MGMALPNMGETLQMVAPCGNLFCRGAFELE